MQIHVTPLPFFLCAKIFPYKHISVASISFPLAINVLPHQQASLAASTQTVSVKASCCAAILPSFSAQLGIFVLFGFSFCAPFKLLPLPSVIEQCSRRTLLQLVCRIDSCLLPPHTHTHTEFAMSLTVSSVSSSAPIT